MILKTIGGVTTLIRNQAYVAGAAPYADVYLTNITPLREMRCRITAILDSAVIIYVRHNAAGGAAASNASLTEGVALVAEGFYSFQEFTLLPDDVINIRLSANCTIRRLMIEGFEMDSALSA